MLFSFADRLQQLCKYFTILHKNISIRFCISNTTNFICRYLFFKRLFRNYMHYLNTEERIIHETLSVVETAIVKEFNKNIVQWKRIL